MAKMSYDEVVAFLLGEDLVGGEVRICKKGNVYFKTDEINIDPEEINKYSYITIGDYEEMPDREDIEYALDTM
jgi:hypothetical protein